MTEKAKIAVELFNKKLHCSQSILAAYADECGISYEQAAIALEEIIAENENS